MKASVIHQAARTHGRRLGAALQQLVWKATGPLTGVALLVLCWQIGALNSTVVPAPATVFGNLVDLLSSPFAVSQGQPTGLGWVLLITFKRLVAGYAVAACCGLILGFAMGRSPFMGAILQPLINLFRHVSPLAWLPFGLIAFSQPQAAAVWTIFICAFWPIVSATSEAIRRVPGDYLKVARTLRLPEYKLLTRIVLPAALPGIVGGLRHGLATAWLVIVAAELFTNSPGIGAWLRAALADLDSTRVVTAILVVGWVGLVLDLPLLLLRRRLLARA
ncbi:MAG: ABC transporter permease [Burkholderiaceae bacterium]